ncbi:hypothetical protein [Streptomyces sp. NPDC059566]|uniref:hypothetical protein n=1 Tax=Streptomyces sp. NPDC059566 TaxID=3346866 RepID=UPI0036952A3D
MRDVLSLLGHVGSARVGLGVEGTVPEALADVEALSGALEAAPALWDATTTDPVLSLDAEHFEKAHEQGQERLVHFPSG